VGDQEALGTFPEIDGEALKAVLAQAIGGPAQVQNTRAIVVVYKGRIIGESFAPGWTPDTPQISWSMGKSITSALVGILVQRGDLSLDQPAPIDRWQQPGDPRSAIRIRDLLQMSSGLDFANLGLEDDASYDPANEHMRIYFDSLNVFEHAVDQPLEIPPGSQFRYRNSDPLSLGRIIRDEVEAMGENYLTFPQRALFDRIGSRNFVLETDAWGNFIMTGYDFGSARDWARFGLLHLGDGVFDGTRILPEGWVEFISSPAPGDPSRGYGGLFWLNRGEAMDRVPPDAFWAAGFMGQRCLVIPSLDLVVVRLGPSDRGFSDYFNDLVGDIIDSIDRGEEP
jgi:CubicO group peptidase (beta-lactamase class C family)